MIKNVLKMINNINEVIDISHNTQQIIKLIMRTSNLLKIIQINKYSYKNNKNTFKINFNKTINIFYIIKRILKVE